MTDADRAEFQQAIATLCGVRQKPGPDKQFPHRLEFRYDDATRTALDTLKGQSGEDASSVIRRLIREAA